MADAATGSSFWICVKMLTEATSVFIGMFPEISTTEPNSPTARAKRETAAGQDRRQQRRQDDPPQDRALVRAEGGRGFLHVPIELEQHRLDGADHERQRDEEERDQDARLRVGEVEPERALRARRGQGASSPATIVGSANGRSISALT